MNTDALIHAIYSVVTNDDGLHRLLVALANAFGCSSATLLYVEPARPLADIAIAHGPLSDPAIRARYERDFASLDPAPKALAALNVCDVASTDVLFTDVERYRPFLEGFYYPLGLYGALGGPFMNASGRVGMVAVQRGAGRPKFDDEDEASFRTIMPHFARAIELRSAFFRLERRIATLDASLEPLGLALMTFEAGQLTQANGAARAILARGDGLELTTRGTLTAGGSTHGALLSERLAAPVRSAVFSVPRTAGGRYFLRSHKISGVDGPSDDDRQVVLVCDVDEVHPDAADLIRDIYGMSAPSARLVAAMLAGQSMEAHAAQAGISLNTAKFHLKGAFAAADTHRQVDLVRRVSRVLDALGCKST